MEQELNQKIDKKIDDLALAVKKGFDEMSKEFGGEFGKMNRRFDDNERDHKIIHQKLEDIELRLSNVVYRFELEDLEKRVKNVETKLNLT